ncbi:hypothetical protein E1B28_013174 [Marasmius oreades]|uniref:Uncharacterized protein n=1 Tax=Marasmius oreades TaxID=181124 RepID=A0A9P7RQF6_9AGAR|nr:uncharacterized protein E1B28_013174 [Marasmius oreades]KAG7087193.1 hypothetical protein E1B28_013174 [Marasmius oreades]
MKPHVLSSTPSRSRRPNTDPNPGIDRHGIVGFALRVAVDVPTPQPRSKWRGTIPGRNTRNRRTSYVFRAFCSFSQNIGNSKLNSGAGQSWGVGFVIVLLSLPLSLSL